MNKFFIIIGLLISLNLFAQRPSPASPQENAICIRNAFIHVGNGQLLENTDLIFDKGKITFIGKNAPANNALIINADGKHVYPGFILLNTILGLIEIDAVRASEDFTEIEEYHPEVRSLVAFNTDSKIIPTVRRNGVLLAQPTLKSGTIWGTSSIVQLDAWNWEDAAVKTDDAIHLRFPSLMNINRKEDSKDRNKKVEESIDRLKDFINRAAVYSNLSGELDFKLHAMSPVFSGNKKLFVEVQDLYEAKLVLEIFEKFKEVNLVFKSQADLSSLADELNERGIPVVISRIHRLPLTPEADVNEAYALPKKYHDAKIVFTLDYEGDMEAMGSRNLPFLAGTSVAYGLPYEKAVESISLNAAKVLGIDKEYGSIELGKSATFFISDGDALDMKSNKLIHAFIDGRSILLSSHQEELEKMYLDKYKNEKKISN